MHGILRDIFIKGTASGISRILLEADLGRLVARADRLGGLDKEQLENLRSDIQARLERVEADGREQRDLLLRVTKELLAAWLPRGGSGPR